MLIPESRVVIFSLFWRFGKNEKSLWNLATFMYWTSMQILWTEVCVPFLLNLRVSKRKSINRSFSQAQRRTMRSKCVCNRVWNLQLFFWGIKRFCGSKIEEFRNLIKCFFAWTLTTSAISRGSNYDLSNLISCSCHLSYELFALSMCSWFYADVKLDIKL